MKDKTTAFRNFLLATAIPMAFAPAAGFAQTAPSETAQAAPDQRGIEEVVVTANRRSEDLQSVPVTIEAFSAEKLSEMQVTTTQQLSDFTPGLNITRANVGSVPFLRGVGNFTATVGNEAAIATYVDEVYRPGAGASTYAFNNLERIEVLDGPQGTLFGRNAAGGVINVFTKDPSQTPHIDAEIGLANYENTTGSFYGTAGITDNLAADLSVYLQRQWDGWGKNLYDGHDVFISREVSLRSKWVWKPTDDDKVTAIIYFDRDRNDQGGASNMIPGSVNPAGYGHIGGFFDVDTNFDGYNETMTYGGSVKEDHDFGWADLVSITSYGYAGWKGNIENDSSPANLQEATDSAKERTYQEELRLSSPDAATIKWMGGLFFYDDRSAQDPFQQWGTGLGARPVVPTQFTFGVQNTRSFAGFGQATAPIFDATNLTLGARWTDDIRNFEGVQYNYIGGILSQSHQRASKPKPTFRVSLDHNFNENILGYVSWNTGFKSGNFNNSNPLQPSTLPETLTAYEAGAKTKLFDNTLQLNGSVFYYTFKDLQVQQQTISGNLLTNAATAKYKGIDMSAVIHPVDRLSITAAAEILNAHYGSYKNALFNFPNPNGLGYVSKVSDASGYDIPFADPLTASAQALYVIPTASSGDFSLLGVVGYHHGFRFDSQGDVRQPSYTVANASVTWTAPSAAYDVQLWADNIFDTRYYAQKQVSSVGLTYSPAAPVTFGIKLKYHWSADSGSSESAAIPAAAVVAPAPAAPAAPARTAEVQRAFQVFFDFDKSDITEAAANVIQAAAASVKAGNVTTINVTGHTDTVGSAPYNQALSERRAAAVKQQLVSDGVSPGEISATGVGKSGLLVSTADGVREPQNRRAEIVLQ